MRAVRSVRAHGGVAGVRFQTDVIHLSDEERLLQDIQSQLAGGVFPIGADDPVPHLYLAEQQEAGGGRGPTVVGLWVPGEERARAEQLLEAAGFAVVGQL